MFASIFCLRSSFLVRQLVVRAMILRLIHITMAVCSDNYNTTAIDRLNFAIMKSNKYFLTNALWITKLEIDRDVNVHEKQRARVVLN